jgi:uncharacterized protein
VQIEFDPAKDAINRAKHGVSLATSADMDFDYAVVIEDRRFDHCEQRFIAYGPIGDRLHVLWFTMRGPVLRAIGLRRANMRERQRYERPR